MEQKKSLEPSPTKSLTKSDAKKAFLSFVERGFPKDEIAEVLGLLEQLKK